MIIHLLPALNKLRIVLASQSPRRIQLLTNIGLHFRAITSAFEENLDKEIYTPQEYVCHTAKAKALDIYEHYKEVGAAYTQTYLCDVCWEKPWADTGMTVNLSVLMS